MRLKKQPTKQKHQKEKKAKLYSFFIRMNVLGFPKSHFYNLGFLF